MTIGEKIKRFWNLRGISQETLGQLSGINFATIKQYEYGIRNPQPNQLLKIANALGISINVFMDFDIETVSDVLSLLLKMDEQLDINFESEKDEFLKDLNAVTQSILDDSKIIKKGIIGISVKIYPENE
ncbi:helix-turn-helix transcriptional regulator [Lachnospiraceae bacterium 62-35]